LQPKNFSSNSQFQTKTLANNVQLQSNILQNNQYVGTFGQSTVISQNQSNFLGQNTMNQHSNVILNSFSNNEASQIKLLPPITTNPQALKPVNPSNPEGNRADLLNLKTSNQIF
jgi:hypothetical protein